MDDIQGRLVLLMAPSGSGKNAIVSGLRPELHEQMYFAKTYTSRAPREGTVENPKYHFISREEFEAMIAADEFIEWAEFSGNLYGTPKSEFVEPLKSPQVVFKEMELKGVQQIKQLIPDSHTTVIYIDAGSWDELQKRIVARAEISEEELGFRKQRYEEEVLFKPEADIVISNRDGELATAQAQFNDIIADLVNSIHA